MTALSTPSAKPSAPADPVPIIDCDIHPRPGDQTPFEPYIPHSVRDALKFGLGGSPFTGYRNPGGSADRKDASCNDPKQTARDHLDLYDLSYAVVQPPGMHVTITNQIDVGNALAVGWNDWLIDTWLAADSRYLGSVSVNMQDPIAAAAEIRRVGGHKQMVQVFTGGEHRDLLGHRRYYPVYEAACEMGLAFCVHPGREGCISSPTPVGRPSTYLEWHTILPITFQAHLVSMVCEGVFEKFPQLNVVLCEGGIAWLIHTVWRLEKNFKGLRVQAPWLKKLPSEYIFNQVKLSTQPIEEPEKDEHLLQMFEMVHAEKTVMFSTDFPHWDFDDPSHVLPRRMDESLRRRILYSNAAETFGLPTWEEKQAELAARKA